MRGKSDVRVKWMDEEEDETLMKMKIKYLTLFSQAAAAVGGLLTTVEDENEREKIKFLHISPPFTVRVLLILLREKFAVAQHHATSAG